MNYQKAKKNSLTLEGLNLPHFIAIILSGLMFMISFYMTAHYLDENFGNSVGLKGHICDLSAYWSCQNANFSSLSNIMHVPIAFFGLIFSLYLLVASFLKSENVEKTSAFLVYLNFISCLLLLGYSVIVLEGICPVCLVYYLLSGGLCFLFYKYSFARPIKTYPSMKILFSLGLVLILASGVFRYSIKDKIKGQKEVEKSIVSQFNELENLGDPEGASPLMWRTKKSEDDLYPINISVFSDFECPACQIFAKQVPQIIKRYQGKVKVSYYPFVLSSECNESVSWVKHRFACKAARLTLCRPDKFEKIHDEIFTKQDNLSDKFLEKLAKKYGANKCMNAPKTNQKLKELTRNAKKFDPSATPTIVVNGVKIEGVLPLNQSFAILDSIIKTKKNKEK